MGLRTMENAKPKLIVGEDHWDLIAIRKIIENLKTFPDLFI